MIDVKSTFIKLTSRRYPHGKESQVIDLLPEFKFEKDEFDNYYIIIKKNDGTFSNTMFSCHLDTIDRCKYSSIDYSNRNWVNGKWEIIDPAKEKTGVDDGSVVHVIDEDFIKTDGNSNLGADDKAGMVIMLNMISENVPGLYYFFQGEESGCIGSSTMSRKYTELVEKGILPSVTKCIAFDRKSYGSIITNQMGGRCCSDEFGTELSKRLNEYGFWYSNDSTGVYTDSAEFTDVIPECTNLSVGYFDEHTLSEKQDIEFLELLALACVKVDWETLPITRTIVDVKYTGKKSRTTDWSSYGGFYDDDDAYSRYYHEHHNRSTSTNTSTTNPPTTTPNQSLRKDVDDFDFDKWYNEQKTKSIIFND